MLLRVIQRLAGVVDEKVQSSADSLEDPMEVSAGPA